MEFKEKLSLIRKDKNLSQEKLAEILGISRQAIAKWELGQAFPDINNLIQLSDIFKISIDRLIKPEDNNYFRSFFNNASFVDDNLINFLCKAKKSTYAGKGAEAEPSRPDSHDLKFAEDEYFYIDTYLGGEKFGGEEAVWYQNKPIWLMNYQGRVTGDGFSGDFLKEALLLVSKEMPYRGPRLYQQGDYIYTCDAVGVFEWFQGYEVIYCKTQKIYECHFHGGEIH